MITEATHQGRRPYQEDRYFSFSNPHGTWMGVFDGHGGDGCAKMALSLITPLINSTYTPSSPIKEVFTEIFSKLNSATIGLHSGCTASLAFIPSSQDVVHVAVLGDSPIIIRKNDGNIWIAPEHNVSTNESEVIAAVGRGGYIATGGAYLVDSYNRLGVGLQMTRALGDVELSRVLNREPEIFSIPIGESSFVLVCTDGAFDPSHYKTVKESSAAIIIKLIETGADASSIVNRAIKIPTRDNVTAVLWRP